MNTSKISRGGDAAPGSDDCRVWTALYAITQQWKRDMEFYEDELSFLRVLIDRHLSLLLEPKNIEQTRPIVDHVMGLERERVALIVEITAHGEGIASYVRDLPSQNFGEHWKTHVELMDQMAAFTNRIRNVKSEVYKLTEKVIHSEKVRKLIGPA